MDKNLQELFQESFNSVAELEKCVTYIVTGCTFANMCFTYKGTYHFIKASLDALNGAIAICVEKAYENLPRAVCRVLTNQSDYVTISDDLKKFIRVKSKYFGKVSLETLKKWKSFDGTETFDLKEFNLFPTASGK